MFERNYKSFAVWPKESGIVDNCGNNASTDFHDTRSQAESVLKLLRKEGFGGDGKIFPLFTQVTKIK